ncbi:MAG: tRNA (5-methylaminomethyl-2-thiouridine)(34)-methyltransferase MnmD [Alphaproteobacteria bacterium]|nr:tRNA (5-methylaminomethyl-2-thiouridine)(34)-methyltransferase MnmD [Alphaproteobacteria bacterium]
MTTPPQDDSLEWRGTVPFATRFADVYYSVDDPRGEVRHTFLEGTNFGDLCRRKRLCVAETGFGTGLNFLEAWAAWARDASDGAHLDFLSVEAYPMGRESMRRAHAAFPEHLARSQQLVAAWPGAVPGIHRIRLAEGRVRLIVMIGEAAEMLSSMSFRADAWFLDGFAPSRNPEMWRPEVLKQVARNSAEGAQLATFTAAGAVRRGLSDQGFKVSKRPGFGRKRDCVTATYTGPVAWSGPPWHAQPAPLSQDSRIAIIGDGIAARAVERALRDRHRSPVRIAGRASRAYAASTLPRALIAPKLIRGDQPFATFWRQAFWDAVRELDALDDGDIWAGPRGLRIAAGTQSDLIKLQKLKDALNWPSTDLAEFAPDGTLPGGLSLSKAGAINPDRLLTRLSAHAAIERDVADIRQHADGWQIIAGDGRIIHEAEAVILACGPGTAALLPAAPGGYGMRIGSGQCLILRSENGPTQAVMKDGYMTAADSEGRFALGATATPRAPLAPVPVSDQESADLLRRHDQLLSEFDARVETAWTGLRCDTGDHLPLVGPVQDAKTYSRHYAGLADGKPGEGMPEATYRSGLFALAALGARGFQGAFLAADLIAAQIDGSPVAVSDAVRHALAPSRFQIRAISRRQIPPPRP